MDNYLNSLFINEAKPALRRHSGGGSVDTEAIRQEAYAEGVEAGKKAEYDAFWDNVTNYGNRIVYVNGFAGWGNEYLRPNRKIIPTVATSGNSTFNACPNLKKVEAAYFDFSQKERGASNTNGWYYTFYNCPELEEIEDIGLTPQSGYYATFANCRKLHTIAAIRTDENTMFSGVFNFNNELINLKIIGVIGQNGINLQSSPKLSHDSLMSIINTLADKSADTSGTAWLVTIGSRNYAKLTEEELTIAYEKGWDVQ